MKTLLAIITLSFFSLTSHAQWNDSELAGLWSLSCTQTQINNLKGYTLETYTFSHDLSFEFERQWFTASDCSGVAFTTTTESGVLGLGRENTNNGFNPKGTLEANFKVEEKLSQGLLWLNPEGSKMRLSRGAFGSSRNTMLGFFQYSKR